MTDLELAEEIEGYVARTGRDEMVLTYPLASWQQILAALRRGTEPVPDGFVRTVPDPLGQTMCTAQATGQWPFNERPPSGEMVMGLRVIVNPDVPADEVWITNAHGKRLGTIVNLSTAEASK